MAPDGKKAQVEKLLNKEAAKDVQKAQKTTISAAPADPDIVELAFESEVLRYVSEWLATNLAKASDTKPFAFVFSRSIEADMALLKTAGVSNPVQYQAFHSQKLLAVFVIWIHGIKLLGSFSHMAAKLAIEWHIFPNSDAARLRDFKDKIISR